jgi:hypothetical protein
MSAVPEPRKKGQHTPPVPGFPTTTGLSITTCRPVLRIRREVLKWR